MNGQDQPLHIRVFLSSPGDVADERGIALRLFDRVQYDPLLRGQITIEAVAWDKPGADTPMLATMTPQEAINRGLPKPSECSIVIVILWARLGTPLPDTYRKPDGSRYLSGTEWEFYDAMNAASERGIPLVVVYRRTEDIAFNPKDVNFNQKVEQWQRVEHFFEQFVNPDGSIQQGFNTYASPAEFESKFETHLKALIKQLIDQPRAQTSASAPRETELSLWEGSPFPGLRAFTQADAPIFFGRSGETDILVKRYGDLASQLVVVVGASGSGKSSLVGAGLLPRLASNAVEGSKEWLTVRFSPGQLASGNPFEALAVAITAASPELNRSGIPVREWTTKLQSDPDLLNELVEKTLEGRPKWAKVFFFIDQFEELFTLVQTSCVEPFINLLVGIVGTDRIRTVITVRADFYARCLESPKLAALFKNTTYPLAAPDLGALYEMITRPAARAGLEFDDGLPEQILRDTGTDPGALALMAYTLDELYHASANSHRLTHAAYEKLNGVQGAIAARAESAFAELDTEAQASLPIVFRELTEIDERGTAIRRPANLSTAGRTEAARRLIDRLVAARLLVQSSGESGQPVIEVSHEALLRNWKRLAAWIEVTQDDLRLARQVRLAAEEWNRAGHNESDLLTGTRLDWARSWLKTGTVPPSIEEFIQTSIAAEERAQQEAEERRATEIRLKQQAADRLRLLAMSLAIFLVIAVGLSLITLNQRAEAVSQAESAANSAATATHAQGEALAEANNAQIQAERAQNNAATATFAQGLAVNNASTAEWQSEISRALALSAQAQLELQGSYAERAIPLAMEALQDYPYTTQAERTLYQAMRESRLRRTLTNRQEPMTVVQWSPNGKLLLAASRDGTVVVSSELGTELVTLTGHTSGIADARWSPDGNRIVTASADNTAIIWDAQTGTALHVLPDHHGTVNSAAWSPDGKRIVTASDDGTAMIWDAEKGTLLSTLLPGNPGAPDCLGQGKIRTGFSPTIFAAADLPLLGGGGGGGGGGGNGTSSEDNAESNPVIDAEWSPDGTEIASTSGTALRIWNADCGRLDTTHDLQSANLTALDWSSSNRLIAYGDANGIVRIWDPTKQDEDIVLVGNLESIRDIEWSKNGDRLLSVSASRAIVWWDQDGSNGGTPIPQNQQFSLTGHIATINHASWSLDNTQIATASDDGTAKIWDTRQLELLDLPPLAASDDAASDDAASKIFYTVDAIWSPDSQQIASASSDGDAIAVVWDSATGGMDDTLSLPTPEPVGSWSDDLLGKIDFVLRSKLRGGGGGGGGRSVPTLRRISWQMDRIAGVDGSNHATVWAVPGGDVLFSLRLEEGVFNDVALSPDGKRVLLLGSLEAAIWDIDNNSLVASLPQEEDAYRDGGWSPDGSRVLTLGKDQNIAIWDAGTGERQSSFAPSRLSASVAAWSPDGSRIASADAGGTVFIWNPDSPETPLLTLSGHTDWVSDLTWSPDMSQLASVSWDGTIRLWNAGTGEQWMVLADYGAHFQSAAWSPDGSRILTVENENLVRVWRLWHTPEELLDFARECCDTYTLTEQERVAFNLPVGSATPMVTTAPSGGAAATATPQPTPGEIRQAVIGSQRGAIGMQGHELWQFEGQAGDVINIRVNADYPANQVTDEDERRQRHLFDPQFIVSAPDGSVIVTAQESDDVETHVNTDSQYLGLRLPVTGTYVIEVRAFLDSTEGAYTLLIDAVEPAAP